ncbi:hypothetical protein GCM10022280_12320 [Sphingomonas swuensis]|uniref:Uncharacterized protein n=1 Tax=Sphingomonas swuensis TaxID=977800 RepID=A0ABP7SQZ0_9SPHN
MGIWRHLLGGMLLWTAHFFAAYGIASLLPGSSLAAVLVLIVTALAFGGAMLLLAATLRRRQADEDGLRRWSSEGGAVLYGLAGVAILYQGLPALLA